MPSLGELTVALGAVTGQFRSDLNESKGALKSTATAMRGVVNMAAKLGVAAGVAGAAIFAGLVKRGLEFIDVQAKIARNTGSTIDGIRALQIATGDYGVEQAELNKLLEMFSGRIGEAMRESGSATSEMFQSLGIDVRKLAEMDIDEQMATIADRVHDLGLNAQQTGDLLRQLGIRSLEMVDVFRDGGGAIRAARQEVDEFGLSLSMVDANQVEAANDAMERISRVTEGVSNKLAVAFAPMLKEIADRFNNAAKENNGFGEQAMRVAEFVIRSFGKFLDVVHGIRTAFKAGELVAKSFGAAVISTVQLSINIWAKLIHGMLSGLNLVRKAMKLPPLEAPEGFDRFVETVNHFGEEARNEVSAVRAELHALAMTEMPSEKFERFLTDVKNRSREASLELQNVRGSMDPDGAEGFGTEFDPEVEAAKAKAEALRQQLADRVQMIAESNMEEAELAQLKFEQDLAALTAAREQEIITDQQFMATREDLEDTHMKNLKDIREKHMTDLEKFMAMSWQNQAKTAVAGIAQMTASLSSGSKTMFNINKAAGLASASISMFQGIAAGLKLGWPLAIPAVAYAAATGAAQIANIRSQSFGGGGGASPTIAAAPALPTTPTGGGAGSGGGERGNDQIVRIQGLDPTQMFSGRQVVDLLNSAVKDGAKLVVE